MWGLMILHLAYSACQVPSSCAALYWSFVQHSANLVFSCDHCVPGILVSIEIAWSLPQYICGVKNEGPEGHGRTCEECFGGLILRPPSWVSGVL